MDDLDRYYQATLEYQMLGTPELEKEIESLETKIKSPDLETLSLY